MTCPEITTVVWTYQVCALTMFALSQHFRVIVLEHTPDYVHVWQLFSETTFNLYTVRLQLYKSCTMMFTLVVSITNNNVDYLGTSKMDKSWLCSSLSTRTVAVSAI